MVGCASNERNHLTWRKETRHDRNDQNHPKLRKEMGRSHNDRNPLELKEGHESVAMT